MKKFNRALLCGLALIALAGCVGYQKQTFEVKPVVEIIEVPGKTKNELYLLTHIWLNELFKDSKSVVQFTDKESGTITGKYMLGTLLTASQYREGVYAMANIRITLKDGKALIVIEAYSTQEEYYNDPMFIVYDDFKAQQDIVALVDTYKLALSKDAEW